MRLVLSTKLPIVTSYELRVCVVALCGLANLASLARAGAVDNLQGLGRFALALVLALALEFSMQDSPFRIDLRHEIL